MLTYFQKSYLFQLHLIHVDASFPLWNYEHLHVRRILVNTDWLIAAVLVSFQV